MAGRINPRAGATSGATRAVSSPSNGLGQRAVSRITGVNRRTVADLALKVGFGCAPPHDGKMTGLRMSRLELDELWAYVGRKRKRVKPNQHDAMVKGDQYTYVGLAAAARAIISYRTGKRDTKTPWSSSTICASASSARLRFQRTASTRTSRRSATCSPATSLMA
jgi:hypothetical protein